MTDTVHERFFEEQLQLLAYEIYRTYIEENINREELYHAYGCLEELQELSCKAHKRVETKLKRNAK